MQVPYLSGGHPLEKGMATHSSIQRSMAGYGPRGPRESDVTERLSLRAG